MYNFFRNNIRSNVSMLDEFFLPLLYRIFPSGGTTPEVQRTLRGGPWGTADLRVQSPGGFARGGTVFRGLQPSEARLRRAKRSRPAERSEAPPSEARAPPRLRRAKRGRAGRSRVIGRSAPLQKNSKRFHQKAQGNHLLKYFRKWTIYRFTAQRN